MTKEYFFHFVDVFFCIDLWAGAKILAIYLIQLCHNNNVQSSQIALHKVYFNSIMEISIEALINPLQ